MSNFDVTRLDHHQIVDVQTSIYNWDKDINDVFTLVQYKRIDGSLYKDIHLSGGTSPYYTTKTMKIYDVDGTTILYEYTWALTYINNILYSEVII